MSRQIADPFHLLCGCRTDLAHRPGCLMARAEIVAVDAVQPAYVSPGEGGPTVSIICALYHADLLLHRELTDEQRYGLLDALWDLGLLRKEEGDDLDPAFAAMDRAIDELGDE